MTRHSSRCDDGFPVTWLADRESFDIRVQGLTPTANFN